MKNLIDTSENMTTNYYLNILIYNDLGELIDKRFGFETLDDMSLSLWKNNTVDHLIDDAREYALENNMVIEDFEDEDDDEDREDLSSTSPLNNPANFAN